MNIFLQFTFMGDPQRNVRETAGAADASFLPHRGHGQQN